MNSEHIGDEAGRVQDLTADAPRGWRLITDIPEPGTAVLVYHANVIWRNSDGKTLDKTRDHVERTAIGFYDRGAWLESGTGHDMFESWREPSHLPTHWMALPPGPA